MSTPAEYSYPRYLEAKRTVDRRSLNIRVWTRFIEALKGKGSRIQLLEVGAGVGATAERILNALLASPVERVEYTLVDINSDNLSAAKTRLHDWLHEHNFTNGAEGEGGMEISLHFEVADLYDFISTDAQGPYDALVSQAVFDLLPVKETLAALRPVLQPEGLWYLPIHFDGVTAFEPSLDPDLDAEIERLYHRSMIEQSEQGRGLAGPHTGRRLLTELRGVGATLLEAGSSDWVVFAGKEGYPADEAYFLYHILRFVEEELTDHPSLDSSAFKWWVKERRRQIEREELIYVAHQLDVLACQLE